MNYETVIQGMIRFLENEIYTGMNDWQEILARIAVSRLLNNKDRFKEFLRTNTFVQTFGIMDSDGRVDVDGLMRDLKEQIARKGKIEISIPMFGKFGFVESDVDRLEEYIRRVS